MYGKKQMTGPYRVLDTFYREYFKKNSNMRLGYYLGTGGILALLGIFMMIPYQEFAEEKGLLFLVMMLGSCATGMYMASYRVYMNKDNRIDHLKRIFQNIPLSGRIWWRYRFAKLLNFQTKVYVVLQIGQLFFSLVLQHGIGPENILYPFLGAFAIPMLINGLALYMDSGVNFNK